MDASILDLVICLPRSGLIRDTKAVVSEFSFSNYELKLGTDKMLKHRTDIICSSALSLQFSGLI